jgi:hypothetical protein
MAGDAGGEQARIVQSVFDEAIARHARMRGQEVHRTVIHAMCDLIERPW